VNYCLEIRRKWLVAGEEEKRNRNALAPKILKMRVKFSKKVLVDAGSNAVKL